MVARRIEPKIRCRRFGMNELPSGRRVFVTHSGLMIGLRYLRPALERGVSDERVQKLVLHRRPLAWDQVLVAALCEPGRRP